MEIIRAAAGGGAGGSLENALFVLTNKPNPIGGYAPNGSSAIGTPGNGGYGLIGSAALTTGTLSLAEEADDEKHLNAASAAAGGSEAGWSMPSANFPFNINQKSIVLVRFKMPSATTDVRFYLGLNTIGTLATVAGADDFGGLSMGLQYSTPRGDANWQFLIDDNTTRTLTNTAIPADILLHYLLIKCDSSTSVTMTLFNAAGATQFTNTYITALPAATTDFLLTGVGEAQIASARGISTHFIWCMNRPLG